MFCFQSKTENPQELQTKPNQTKPNQTIVDRIKPLNSPTGLVFSVFLQYSKKCHAFITNMCRLMDDVLHLSKLWKENLL